MAVFGEEGVQMNSAIDQNLIRYTTPHTVPAKRTSNHRPGYFFIANAKAHPAGGCYTGRTKWGPRDTHRAFSLAGGTRTLILHGSNDPLLSGVRADIGGVKADGGRGWSFVKRLSNDYIHVCVAEKGKEGGGPCPALARCPFVWCARAACPCPSPHITLSAPRRCVLYAE